MFVGWLVGWLVGCLVGRLEGGSVGVEHKSGQNMLFQCPVSPFSTPLFIVNLLKAQRGARAWPMISSCQEKMFAQKQFLLLLIFPLHKSLPIKSAQKVCLAIRKNVPPPPHGW